MPPRRATATKAKAAALQAKADDTQAPATATFKAPEAVGPFLDNSLENTVDTTKVTTFWPPPNFENASPIRAPSEESAITWESSPSPLAHKGDKSKDEDFPVAVERLLTTLRKGNTPDLPVDPNVNSVPAPQGLAPAVTTHSEDVQALAVPTPVEGTDKLVAPSLITKDTEEHAIVEPETTSAVVTVGNRTAPDDSSISKSLPADVSEDPPVRKSSRVVKPTSKVAGSRQVAVKKRSVKSATTTHLADTINNTTEGAPAVAESQSESSGNPTASDPDENNAPAAELGSPFRQRKPPTNPVTPPVSKVAMQKLLNPKRIRRTAEVLPSVEEAIESDGEVSPEPEEEGEGDIVEEEAQSNNEDDSDLEDFIVPDPVEVARLAKAAKSRKHNRGAETVVEQKSDVPARSKRNKVEEHQPKVPQRIAQITSFKIKKVSVPTVQDDNVDDDIVMIDGDMSGCVVTRADLQDALLAHTYAGLYKYSQVPKSVVDEDITTYKFSTLTSASFGNVDMGALTPIVTFSGFRAGNIVNPARADPTQFQIKVLSAKTTSPTLVQANVTTLCCTVGYVATSNLATAREIGDRISKDITVYPVAQEWERTIAFFCVVFGDNNLEVPKAMPGAAVRFSTVMTRNEPPKARSNMAFKPTMLKNGVSKASGSVAVNMVVNPLLQRRTLFATDNIPVFGVMGDYIIDPKTGTSPGASKKPSAVISQQPHGPLIPGEEIPEYTFCAIIYTVSKFTRAVTGTSSLSFNLSAVVALASYN